MDLAAWILNEINALDTALFWTIHLQLRTPFLDTIMPFFSHPYPFWKNIMILISAGLLIFGGRRVRIAMIMLIIAVGLTDIISSKILKEVFHRLRPYDALKGLTYHHVRSYAFPSSHAANSSAFATILFFRSRRLSYPFIGMACMVCYSRIYMGAHYPLDVLGGMILGVFMGTLVSKTETAIKTHLSSKTQKVESENEIPAQSDIKEDNL